MKILVIQQKMIGDVLISSLLCENLKKAYPAAQIDYMVYESTKPVLQGNPSFDSLVLFKTQHRKSKLEFFTLLKSIRKEKYDLVIDAYSKLESWLVVAFSGADRKISYYKKNMNFLYTDVVQRKEKPTSNIGRIIEDRLALLEPLHLPFKPETIPKIYVTEEEKEFATQLFETHGLDTSKRTVMLSILGSAPNKTYPPEYMAQLIDFIAEKKDVNLLFNYIPAQEEEATAIYNLCKESTREQLFFDLKGNSLREFIAIMNNCDAIIGNDGGAINMAKALHKPAFIIFSPWIDKLGWATFEDGINNISLHLKDFKPEVFKNKSDKTIKQESAEFYKKFTPDLIKPKLSTFIESHF